MSRKLYAMNVREEDFPRPRALCMCYKSPYAVKGSFASCIINPHAEKVKPSFFLCVISYCCCHCYSNLIRSRHDFTYQQMFSLLPCRGSLYSSSYLLQSSHMKKAFPSMFPGTPYYDNR